MSGLTQQNANSLTASTNETSQPESTVSIPTINPSPTSSNETSQCEVAIPIANPSTASSNKTSQYEVAIMSDSGIVIIPLKGPIKISDYIYSVPQDRKLHQDILDSRDKSYSTKTETAPGECLGSKDQEADLSVNNKPFSRFNLKRMILTTLGGLLLGGTGTSVVVNDTSTLLKQPSSESCQVRLVNPDSAYNQINGDTTETDSKVILGNCPSEQKEDVKEKTKIITWPGAKGQSITLTFKGGQLVEKQISTGSH